MLACWIHHSICNYQQITHVLFNGRSSLSELFLVVVTWIIIDRCYTNPYWLVLHRSWLVLSGTYFCLNMILITLSCFVSVIVINLYNRCDKKKRIPDWVRMVCREYSHPNQRSYIIFRNIFALIAYRLSSQTLYITCQNWMILLILSRCLR